MNLGYCCINLTLQEESKVSTNRSMIKSTFAKKGLTYTSELIRQNVDDLAKIITWNHDNDINLYRMSSSMFPWMSEYELPNLPEFNYIHTALKKCGDLAKKYNQRLTFHPGPFNVFPSPNPDVVTKTHKELRQHTEIMDLMGLDRTPYNAINIHVGGAYNNKESTLNKFVEVYKTIDPSIKARMVIENDDKPALYSAADLYNGLYLTAGVPITFDFFHHQCHPGELSEAEALEYCIETWPKGINPLTHFSSSKKIHEDVTAKTQAHAEFLYSKINTHGFTIDVEIEAKAKELALIEYRNKY